VLCRVQQGKVLVLHGFIKKTQDDDLAPAGKRNREFDP
jgi:phage-related protein